jgi:hypothetical protein
LKTENYRKLRTHPGLLAPALRFWMGDNLQLASRFEEAQDAYGEVAARFADRRINGASWAAVALEESAHCHHAAGDPDAAAGAYREILRSHGEGVSAARMHHGIGRLLEESGDDRAAITAYHKGADSPDWPVHSDTNHRELARRAAERLESSREWFVRRPEELASRIARALTSRDAEAIRSLASRTHFSAGYVGSERAFVHRDRMLDLLEADLRASRVSCDPRTLRGSRNKLYLATDGWEGSLLEGRVLFLLTAERDGYEFSGIGLTRMRPKDGDYPEIPEEPPPTTPPPPRIPPRAPTEPTTVSGLMMRAPWPAGTHMRAGGIIPFSGQLALFAALTYGMGPFAPLAFAALMVGAAAASKCGFGPGGLYYGQPTTHVSSVDSLFAVDFARFVQGVPLLLNARGVPVLSVASGAVLGANGNFASGDATGSNTVVVGHAITAASLAALLSGGAVPRFITRYLHLDGPGLVPVSAGMFVPRGGRLGLVDDTGLSVADHLHFSLHDLTLPAGATSVRPTPLDGQTLNDSDDGRCMFSTNVPIPP